MIAPVNEFLKFRNDPSVMYSLWAPWFVLRVERKVTASPLEGHKCHLRRLRNEKPMHIHLNSTMSHERVHVWAQILRYPKSKTYSLNCINATTCSTAHALVIESPQARPFSSLADVRWGWIWPAGWHLFKYELNLISGCSKGDTLRKGTSLI